MEKKRRQLIKEYDRVKKREDRKRSELRKKLSVDDAGIIRELNTNEYEKNKASASKSSIRRFVITEKAPTRAFCWLKAATTAFTFKTLLRHYDEQALTPR